VLERVWPRQVGQTLIHNRICAEFNTISIYITLTIQAEHLFGFSIVCLCYFFKGLNNRIMLANVEEIHTHLISHDQT
jgi:hypothetical protein